MDTFKDAIQYEFGLMQSNHGNPANTATEMTGDSSKWETTPASATN